MTTTLFGKSYKGRPMMNSFALFLLNLCERGEEAKAKRYLDDENSIRALRGEGPLDLADDMTPLPMDGLVTCPADQLTDVEHLGPGRIAA